jgi:ubiquinone/menaquinone biosynthesis C-methylase UbiE
MPMPHQRLDYDQIADRYDAERYRGKEADPDLLAFLQQRPDLRADTVAVLDIACGTGSQLVADRRTLPGTRLVGLDLFQSMLRQAQHKASDIGWVRGDGARLPFADQAFDLVTNQFAFHHVRDKRSMFGEVCRVLRPRGRFVMTNIDPYQMPEWALYRYFPAALREDLKDFAPQEQVTALVQEAGLALVRMERHFSESVEDLRDLRHAVRQRVSSQLLVISDRDYQAGLARIERELRHARGQPVSLPTCLCLMRFVADRPG